MARWLADVGIGLVIRMVCRLGRWIVLPLARLAQWMRAGEKA
jgi:hypothetical protein